MGTEQAAPGGAAVTVPGGLDGDEGLRARGGLRVDLVTLRAFPTAMAHSRAKAALLCATTAAEAPQCWTMCLRPLFGQENGSSPAGTQRSSPGHAAAVAVRAAGPSGLQDPRVPG